MHVFEEGGPLHPILECDWRSRAGGTGVVVSDEGGGAVCVGQQVLDIELWLAEVLRGPLNQHQLQQYFLSDYAVHVSDVSGHHHHTMPHTTSHLHCHQTHTLTPSTLTHTSNRCAPTQRRLVWSWWPWCHHGLAAEQLGETKTYHLCGGHVTFT